MPNQFGRKYPAISIHETLYKTLQVDWEQEFHEEYSCPHCQTGIITGMHRQPTSTCKLALNCGTCKKSTHLTCPVPVRIARYERSLTCPNLQCIGIGPDQQKGWIYRTNMKRSPYRCHFCRIAFNSKSQQPYSWVHRHEEVPINPIIFKEDVWDLRQFVEKSHQRTIGFSDIHPDWYKDKVKRYFYFLLEQRTFTATSHLAAVRGTLAQLGKVLHYEQLGSSSEISRATVLRFIDSCSNVGGITLKRKLQIIKVFFEWLELNAEQLVKSRDLPKACYGAPNWLDEPTRHAIQQHLSKIPEPIARHYLVQEYMAARPADVCHLQYDCLVQENSRWYIHFFQQKVSRWHKLPANREIRRAIEAQQHWIRETLGNEYPYLFCHFSTIYAQTYPIYPNLKPLPKPPRVTGAINPMVRIIRHLIEREKILDANGQPPRFTGKITRASRLQEVRSKHGLEAAQLYADHTCSSITIQHYAPPTSEQLAKVDLPFQKLLLNLGNQFLPWQSLPESLLQNLMAHELDTEIAHRQAVYGYCALDPKDPCPYKLYPQCYGCGSFRPSLSKLSLYENQYVGEERRLYEAQKAGAELACEEAKSILTAMDKWLPALREVAHGES